MSARPVMIMAAGTGGHIFPGLAVARELNEQSVPVVWLGTPHGLENRLVPEAGFPLERISITGLRGRGAAGWLAAPFRVLKAMRQSKAIIKRHDPRAVLSMGGYVAGPGGMAARLARRRLIVHEQNSIPGLTNRILSRFAERVFEGFPGSFPASRKAQHSGNPVRETIAAIPEPSQRMAGREGPIRLLVIGGSQGAKALNEVLPRALVSLPEAQRPSVWHQCGERHHEAAKAAWESSGIDARVAPFINDMAEAWSWCDLAICRAGALTIAELTAAGVAAILVPFPFAVDDHQTHNARFLSDAGAAVLAPESELTPDALARLLGDLCGSRERLVRMAEVARDLRSVDAAREVARACLEEAA